MSIFFSLSILNMTKFFPYLNSPKSRDEIAHMSVYDAPSAGR